MICTKKVRFSSTGLCQSTALIRIVYSVASYSPNLSAKKKISTPASNSIEKCNLVKVNPVIRMQSYLRPHLHWPFTKKYPPTPTRTPIPIPAQNLTIDPAIPTISAGAQFSKVLITDGPRTFLYGLSTFTTHRNFSTVVLLIM